MTILFCIGLTASNFVELRPDLWTIQIVQVMPYPQKVRPNIVEDSNNKITDLEFKLISERDYYSLRSNIKHT